MDETLETVRARRIEIVDEEDRPRIVMSAPPRGPHMSLYGEDGMIRASVFNNSSGSRVAMYDRTTKERMRMELDDRGAGTVALSDTAGMERLIITSPPVGNPIIVFRDGNLSVRVAIGVMDGRPMIDFMDADGSTIMKIGHSRVGPTVAIIGPDGEPQIAFPHSFLSQAQKRAEEQPEAPPAEQNIAGTMRWTREMSVGIELLDTQHKEMFQRLNELENAIKTGKEESEINRLTQHIYKFVGTHFDVEENYMKTFGYPDYESHRIAHDSFATDFEIFADKLRRGGMNSVLVLEMRRKVSNWEMDHVMKMDKPMCDYILTKRREKESRETAQAEGQ